LRACPRGSFASQAVDISDVPFSLPPSNLIVEQAARRLDQIILTMIAKRRRSGKDRGDLLSMLLHAQDEESGRRMTDDQLCDEAMTLFMAGHETTANTLAWVWCLLANHPESEAKLQTELDAVLGDRPPTLADLPQLKYTGLVVTEALRIYPTVWMVGRENIEPVELSGYKIPAGTTVFMP
jgi:cytochrome P450